LRDVFQTALELAQMKGRFVDAFDAPFDHVALCCPSHAAHFIHITRRHIFPSLHLSPYYAALP
jgi:hypothetical protein